MKTYDFPRVSGTYSVTKKICKSKIAMKGVKERMPSSPLIIGNARLTRKLASQLTEEATDIPAPPTDKGKISATISHGIGPRPRRAE